MSTVKHEHRVLFNLLMTSLIALLAACASDPPPRYSTANIDTTSLHALQTLSKQNLTTVQDINPIRLQALREIALELGARGGLARRSEELNKTLTQNARNLDQTFNFVPMILHKNIVPPVLTEGRLTLNQSGPNTIRISDHTYKILKQARFVTTPPTWRSYLWMNYPKPKPPEPGLLPKTIAEEKVWQEYITKGWYEGVAQANTIFNANLSRLKQDFSGMALYRTLLAKRMISEPYVATTDLGITGDKDELNINDQVLRITALPQLQTDPSKWQAAIINPAHDQQKWRRSTGK